jgi:hypothetical protein
LASVLQTWSRKRAPAAKNGFPPCEVGEGGLQRFNVFMDNSQDANSHESLQPKAMIESHELAKVVGGRFSRSVPGFATFLVGLEKGG